MNNETDPENKKHFFVIPYVRNISEITASLINKSLFTVGFRIIRLIKLLKYKRSNRICTKKII